MQASLHDRLRETRCDRAAFTPDHAGCVCRLANEAADEIERQAEVIGDLCLSIAHAAEDIKDQDPDRALAILNAALRRQGCETI